MPRDNFKESVKAALRDRVAHRCSNPNCRVSTAAPGSGATGVIRGGDAAHITGASPRGPRYDASISSAERSSIGNGIWLCVVCARKVDHDQDTYSIGLLRGWKASAEAAATQEFGRPLVTDAQLNLQMQILVAQQDQAAQLAAIRAALAASGQVGVEPLDHLLDALRRLADSGRARGSAAMQLSSDGRYEDAAIEALRLAEDEALAATHLGAAAKEARIRAAARWIDAGDIAFVSNPQRAVDAYERCTEIDPSNPFGWSRLGEASWWAGRLDKALNAFTRLWAGMPESDVLFEAGDPVGAQKALSILDGSSVSREERIWVVRGIVISGLNIVEILRCQPSLVAKWVFRIVPIESHGGLGKQREPTEVDAAMLIQFFSERIYNLGNAFAPGAVSVEHRRILATLASVSRYRGELDRSEEYLQRARAMNVERRDFVTEAGYLSNLGVIAATRGQTNTARDYFSQALALCKGDPRLGRLYVSTQRLSAYEVERRRIEHERQLAADTVDSALQDGEIEVCNLLSEEFDHDTEIAMEKVMRLKEIEGNAHGNLAQIALADDDLELARCEYEISLAIHESIGNTRGATISREALVLLNSDAPFQA